LIDENNKEYDVYFSKICGEHSTFKIREDDIIEKHGEDSSAYLNYFMSKLKKGSTPRKDWSVTTAWYWSGFSEIVYVFAK